MCQTNSSLYFILLHSFFVLCLNLFLSSISRMNCISSETRETSLLLTKSNTCVMCASCVKCRKYIRLPVECKWPTNCGAKNLLGFFFSTRLRLHVANIIWKTHKTYTEIVYGTWKQQNVNHHNMKCGVKVDDAFVVLQCVVWTIFCASVCLIAYISRAPTLKTFVRAKFIYKMCIFVWEWGNWYRM